MKLVLAILVGISFVSIVTFGFAAMGHGNGHGHNGCIAAMAKNQPCPDTINAFKFATFHLDLLKNFWTAIILFALSIFAIVFVAMGRVREALQIVSMPHAFSRFPVVRFLPLQKKFLHWLFLHLHSPTSF